MARDIYEDHDELSAEPAKDALGNGLVIMTTIVLLVACWAMQTAMNDHFNAGMFAEKEAGP